MSYGQTDEFLEQIANLKRERDQAQMLLAATQAQVRRQADRIDELERAAAEAYKDRPKTAPEPVPTNTLKHLEEMLRERLANEIAVYGKTPTDVSVIVQALAEMRRMVREG